MWLAIIILLVVGILLIVTELIFIPGTTIFGIAGLILSAAGVIMTFVNFGSSSGFITLGITFGLVVILLILSFRSETWEGLSLKSANTGRVNEDVKNNLWVGDQGIALSALRPGGKAEFNDTVVEVSTLGQYIEDGSEVKIISIKGHRIIVESVSTHQTKTT
ncbi:NfeD family protein [Porifericola rhodea]|uniref:NfeD family protein n=1 Tax=Porifericola rhodea TaxID=930972 RepID=UPI0026669C33|nr:NfeD family protein [Porifericola rhodea]WKN32376.1 NfeD family protein [Porifericola rhodea]